MIPSSPTKTTNSSNQQPSTNTATIKDPSTYQENTGYPNPHPYTQGDPANLHLNDEINADPDKSESKNSSLIYLLVTIIILVVVAGVLAYWFLVANKTEEITPTIQTDNSYEDLILPNSKEDETDNVDTVTEPALTYSINYYNVDTAQNVSLVTVSSIDSGKKKTIEESLAYMNTNPNFIEEYAFVIMDGNISRDGSIPVGIRKDGKQVLIGTIGENEDGAASELNKYIVLDSSLDSGELRAVLAHEIGHLVWGRLSPEQAKNFMETRNMTTAMISSWFNYLTKVANGQQSSPPIGVDVWTKSPSEDFAEVFKQVFGGPQDGGNYWTIKTVYGKQSEQTTLWLKNETSPIFQIQ